MVISLAARANLVGGWGGGGARFIFSEIRPPADPLFFLRYPYLMTDPKKWRQYILILSGERAPKKREFLLKIFQKVPRNAFFLAFFQNFACGAESLTEAGSV